MKRIPTAVAVTRRMLRDWPLPEPEEGSGKEGRGRVLVLGGTDTVPGAILLAGEAALRAGAGKLQLGAPESVRAALAIAVPEARVVGIRTDASGNLANLPTSLTRDLAEADAVLVGPGMDDRAGTKRFTAAVLRGATSACVLDAGALGVLSGLGKTHAGIVATPHWGEMASLVDVPLEDIAADPARFSTDFAVRHRVVLVLKSATTFIASPEGALWRHTGGSVGLGTSGSGDVLAGLIAGLIARGATPEQAAVWGVAIHGIAGTQLSRAVGRVGFLARELAALFSSAIEKVRTAR